MKTLGTEEVNFIAKAVAAGIRMDTRPFTHLRPQEISSPSKYASPLADYSALITRGYSQISLSLTFKASLNTLKCLGALSNSVSLPVFSEYFTPILEDTAPLDDLRTVRSTLQEINPAFKLIEKLLSDFNIGCQLETYVISDDGNVFDMIFAGLQHIFRSIGIPDVSDLTADEIMTGIELPGCCSYAVVGSVALADPTAVEEASASGFIRVFSDGHLLVDGQVDSTLHKLVSFIDIEATGSTQTNKYIRQYS